MKTRLDPIRRRLVASTPEEEVRQGLVNWLLHDKGVPLHLMETECSLAQFHKGTPGRVDVLVHGFRQGRGASRPWLLAECKRLGESDWARLEVQVNRYLRTIQPEFLLLQIGETRRILQIDVLPNGQMQASPVTDLPLFQLLPGSTP